MPFKLEELVLENAEMDLLDCVDRVLASPPPRNIQYFSWSSR